MYILGVSSFYHDSAACLLYENDVVAAAQEERFTRIKHDPNFPTNSIKFCIDYANIKPEQISHVVFYEIPFLKFDRLLETYLAFAPKGFMSFSKSMPLWVKDKLFQKKKIIDHLNLIDGNTSWKSKILFSNHHISHASSAFFPSPFKRAAVLTLDGVGEWTTSSISIGEENEVNLIKDINFPHSIGLLYSAFTYFTGFKVNSGEYKVMGLAPYGEPKFTKIIKDNLIDIKDDGSFKLNMTYFDYATGLKMTNNKFSKLFGIKPRQPETNLTQNEMDLASSIQAVTEEIFIKICKNIKQETNENNLCLAGGVALNCVANGILQKEKIFDNIWIQPAAGDAGCSLGAAYAVWFMHLKNKRTQVDSFDSMKGSYLGPEYSKSEISQSLNHLNAKFEYLKDDILIDKVALDLSQQKAIGWMQGRMEFGPRALGARSIIADPRSPVMQKQLNLKVKFRESFRPFAPSILAESQKDWFDLDCISPYMLLVSKINKEKIISMTNDQKKLFGIEKLNIPRSEVPAVTHVDYTARVQTVHKETNSKYYSLLSKFNELSSCPILVNTSFNVRGEPIVCTPEDAYRCFMGTELDVLVIGNYYLSKPAQPEENKESYLSKYNLD